MGSIDDYKVVFNNNYFDFIMDEIINVVLNFGISYNHIIYEHLTDHSIHDVELHRHDVIADYKKIGKVFLNLVF